VQQAKTLSSADAPTERREKTEKHHRKSKKEKPQQSAAPAATAAPNLIDFDDFNPVGKKVEKKLKADDDNAWDLLNS